MSGFGFEFLIALGIGLDGIVLQRGPNWMAVVFLHFAVKNFFLVGYLCREKKNGSVVRAKWLVVPNLSDFYCPWHLGHLQQRRPQRRRRDLLDAVRFSAHHA